MHPNPAFRGEPDFLHLNIARWRGFGALVVPGDMPMPMVSHVPFLLSDDGSEAELHLVRSNPIYRDLEQPRPAMIIVNGPDSYVSPDWYEDKTNSQVPTWNYVAVHFFGTLERRPDDELRDHIDRLSESFEARLAPKEPWTTDKMPEEKLQAMMRAIGVFRFRITELDGTWKVNQNKTNHQREAAAKRIRHSVVGHEVAALSGIMKGLGPRVEEP